MNTSSGIYEAFFRSLPHAAFIIDTPTQKIVEANAQACNWSGYSQQELIGLSMARLFRHEQKIGLPNVLDETRHGTAGHSEQALLLKKDGAMLAGDMNATAIAGQQAMLILVVVLPSKMEQHRVDLAQENEMAARLEGRDFPTIIGHSEKIRHICRRIGDVAKSEVTVLIQGESGTGKEIVANAIHAHSLRAHGPLVKVNCAALSETLLESELFGHVKGAFTGAVRDRAGRFKQAQGGTILLDEIGCLSLAGQAKLLRVLQEHEFEPVGSSSTNRVNVRVLAATNADLSKARAEGKFREDLYYRLNVFAISLPPLRERKEDIPLLAQHFLRKYNLTVGKKIGAFDGETLEAVMSYDWPGNVRELENAVEHAVIVEKGVQITAGSLPMNLTKTGAPRAEPGLREQLNLFEKQVLLNTLMRANWIKKRAADLLHIDARNLPYLLRKHNLCDEPLQFKPLHNA